MLAATAIAEYDSGAFKDAAVTAAKLPEAPEYRPKTL
jgi:hypothetical protein